MSDELKLYKIEVTTNFDRNTGKVETFTDKAMRFIIDTQEKQVRDSLIELGWTPPRAEPDNLVMALEGLRKPSYTQAGQFFDGWNAAIDAAIKATRGMG